MHLPGTFPSHVLLSCAGWGAKEGKGEKVLVGRVPFGQFPGLMSAWNGGQCSGI